MKSSIASAIASIRWSAAPAALSAAIAVTLWLAALSAAFNAAAMSVAHAQSVATPASAKKAATPAHESVRAQAQAIAQVRTLQRAKRADEALRAAERAVRRFPQNTQLRFLLGVTLADAGQPDKAIATFEALTSDHPELAEPYNNLAVLHAAKGNLDAARAALSAAVRVVPDYSLALENLGDIYVRMAQQSYLSAVKAAKPTPGLQRKLTMASDLVDKLSPGQ